MAKDKNKLDLILTENTMNQVDKDLKDKERQKIEDYNQAIHDRKWEDKYSDKELTVLNNLVLVKLLKEPYISEGGIIHAKTFSMPSPSGQQMVTQSDPLPYENRGIIVNIDPKVLEYQPYEIGSMVEISPSIVETLMTGAGPKIKYMYYAPDDERYKGYVLIPSREIILFYKNL